MIRSIGFPFVSLNISFDYWTTKNQISVTRRIPIIFHSFVVSEYHSLFVAISRLFGPFFVGNQDIRVNTELGQKFFYSDYSLNINELLIDSILSLISSVVAIHCTQMWPNRSQKWINFPLILRIRETCIKTKNKS